GSGGSSSIGGGGSAPTPQPRALQRLCRTFQQIYHQQYQMQQQQHQQHQQIVTQQQLLRQRLLLMQQQGHHNGVDGLGVSDLRPWINTEPSMTASEQSITDSRMRQSMSGTVMSVTSTAAGALLSGASGIGSEGSGGMAEGGGQRFGESGNSNNSEPQRTLMLVGPAGNIRARPAAGQLGLPSALSTVPDLPTPITSSCWSRDNSRNPLTSQQLPSNISVFTANTGALSALPLQYPSALTGPAALAALAAATSSSSAADHQSTLDGYIHNHTHAERRVVASSLSRCESTATNYAPLVILGTGGSAMGHSALVSVSPVDTFTRTNEHIGMLTTAFPGSADGATEAAAAAMPGAPEQYGGQVHIPSSTAASSNGEGNATSAIAAVLTRGSPGILSSGNGESVNSNSAPGRAVVPAMLLTSVGGGAGSYGGDVTMSRAENTAAVYNSSVLLSSHQSMGTPGSAAATAASNSQVNVAGAERCGPSSEVWSGSVSGVVWGAGERLATKRPEGMRLVGGSGGSGSSSTSQSVRRSAASVAAAFFLKRGRHHHHHQVQQQQPQQQQQQHWDNQIYSSNNVLSSLGDRISAVEDAGGRTLRRLGSSGGFSSSGANIGAAATAMATATATAMASDGAEPAVDGPRERRLGKARSSNLSGSTSGGALAGMLRTLSKYQKRSSSKNLRT
ncbi:hypothetical protein VaNZ11_005109, partial [Volvox africanus]